jgi:hypothetical protein
MDIRRMSDMRPIMMTLAALALAAPAAASAEVLAPYDGQQVAQYAGVQAWSRQQGDRFALMVRSEGRVAPAPVAAQPVPFAVSLGTDAGGRRLAVYPRCARGSSRVRCRLVAYDLGARRERRLAGTHVAGASEEAVALDRGILTYARRSGDRSTILIGRPGPGRRARVVARLHNASVTGMAITHRALAFSVVVGSTNAPDESRLYVKPAGRPVRKVARGGFGEEHRRTHISPSFAGDHLYWAFADHDVLAAPTGWVARCNLRTGRTSAATTPGYLDAVAADSARPSAPLVIGTFAQKTHGVRGTDQVATLDAPSWQPPPPVLGLTRGVRCNG